MIIMSKWTVNDIGDLSSKNIIITGANSGTGFETAKVLAAKGATIIMACRSMERGERAKKEIHLINPKAKLDLIELDLASLSSIDKFVGKIKNGYDHLDVLINNAGVMDMPAGKTEDGFELHIGINHLGHFALTGKLLGMLLKTPNSRVVTMSSIMHYSGKINFEDIHFDKKFKKVKAYAQSKLANLLFTYELDRRLSKNGSSTSSGACHPGWSRTNLQFSGNREGSKLKYYLYKIANPIMGQSAYMGALPQIYAATSKEVVSGQYTGPRFVARGRPKIVSSNKRSKSIEDANRLWELSEKLTAVDYKELK